MSDFFKAVNDVQAKCQRRAGISKGGMILYIASE